MRFLFIAPVVICLIACFSEEVQTSVNGEPRFKRFTSDDCTVMCGKIPVIRYRPGWFLDRLYYRVCESNNHNGGYCESIANRACVCGSDD